MRATTLKERNKYIDTKSANVDRRALCTYLRTLKDTATDIFHGNHFIDNLDACFLEDADCEKAFDVACMVLSYRLLNIYGAACEIDDCIFEDLPLKEYDSHHSFLCCELAHEYGRQTHYIIAQKAQIPIENDLEDEKQ